MDRAAIVERIIEVQRVALLALSSAACGLGRLTPRSSTPAARLLQSK